MVEGDVASEVAIEGAIIPRIERFRYLGSIIQENGEIDEDINHRIKVCLLYTSDAADE